MNTKIKSAEEILDKKYQPRMHWKLFNRDRVIQAMEEYHAQFKQPDISEDVESEFELLLKIKNELLEADKLPFAKRVEANKDILNFVSIKRKVKPIPTVDEDKLWMQAAEIITGYNIGKKNTTTKHSLNNRIDILKQQFSITRK